MAFYDIGCGLNKTGKALLNAGTLVHRPGTLPLKCSWLGCSCVLSFNFALLLSPSTSCFPFLFPILLAGLFHTSIGVEVSKFRFENAVALRDHCRTRGVSWADRELLYKAVRGEDEGGRGR